MIQFADEALITVRSGKGGNGCISFRREKYIPNGGPNGGDGGRGGDVYICVRRNLRTLAHLRHRQLFKAQNGQDGMSWNRFGKDGEDVDTLLEKDGLKDVVVEKTAKIGEKLSVRRFERVEGDCVVSYLHGGGRIGVLVSAKCANVTDGVKEALQNIAMQVAALSPKFISQKDVDKEFLDKEKEIILAQIENDPKEASKPDKVKEGMVMGRINKEMKEFCLLDQVYVKAEDGKQSVAKYLESVDKDLVIDKFVRFEVGEGMEKKNEDFAAEVAAQMNA